MIEELSGPGIAGSDGATVGSGEGGWHLAASAISTGRTKAIGREVSMAQKANSEDSASKPTLEILFQSDWFCFEARSYYVSPN